MQSWVDRIDGHGGPKYLAIADAIERGGHIDVSHSYAKACARPAAAYILLFG